MGSFATDVMGIFTGMASAASGFYTLLSAMGVLGGLFLIGSAGLEMARKESRNHQSNAYSVGGKNIIIKLLIAGFLLQFMPFLNQVVDMTGGAGAEIRSSVAYVDTAVAGGGFWGAVLKACLAWCALIGAAGAFRGLLLWHKAGSSTGQDGDLFWRGLWHILFGAIAFNFGNFV